MIMGIDEAILGMILNVLLVTALLGLWGMWLQQAKHRKNAVVMLQQAASDLKDATALLESVVKQRHQVQTEPVQHDEIPKQKVIDSIIDKVKQHDQVQLQRKRSAPEPTALLPQQKSNTSAKIMRLSREGLDIEHIAKRLRLPIAQVRLMVLLQRQVVKA